MGTQYEGDPTAFPADFTIPDDGDDRDATSVDVALEALGDRTMHLYKRGHSQLANYAAVRAITGQVVGDIVTVPGAGGDYIFTTSAGTTEDLPFKIKPTAGPGVWLHLAAGGIIAEADGFARLNGVSKIDPVNIENATIAEDCIGPVGGAMNTASETPVDISGCSMTFLLDPGDVLFVEAHAQMTSGDTAVIVPTKAVFTAVVVDGAGGDSWELQSTAKLPDIFPGSVSGKFKYTVVTGGVVTVKGQLNTTHAADSATIQSGVFLAVRAIRA